MIKTIKILLLFISIIFVYSCGGGDTFRVNGRVEGIATQNFFVVYYGDGSYKNTRTAVLDGKFLFEGRSRDLTTVYFFNNQRSLVGFVIVKNGETVDARFVPGNPGATQLEGNKYSDELSKWIRENSEALANGETSAINEAVKKYVEKNPDSFLSSVLLLNFYKAGDNLTEADELFRSVNSQARPAYLAEGWIERIELASDSAQNILPGSLEIIDVKDTLHVYSLRKNMTVIFVPSSLERNEDTDKEIRRLVKNDTIIKHRVDFYEINAVNMDTAEWKKAVRNDSLPWKRYWNPILPQFLVSKKLPVVLLADSTGTILYDGNSINSVINILETQK